MGGAVKETATVPLGGPFRLIPSAANAKLWAMGLPLCRLSRVETPATVIWLLGLKYISLISMGAVSPEVTTALPSGR